jgi:hypothetical protein
MTCCRTESRRLPHFWSEERMTRHRLPSPPWFATSTPLPFSGSGYLRSISGGRTQKRPPTHHPWFPSDSAPSLGSVTASPFLGFAPLSYSRSAFSADTRSCQTGWGCRHPPGSRQRQTLNEPITRTFTPIASWALVRTPSGGFASGSSRTRTS